MKSLFNLLTANVKRQLIVGVALVHAVMMSLFIWDLVERQHQSLMRQQLSQAKVLVRGIAGSGAGWLLSRDVVGLQEIIETQRRYPELVYAMALDRRGHILAHTEKARIGSFIGDLPEKEELTVLQATDQLTDVMMPAKLSGVVAGWIRVGVGPAEAHRQLHDVVREGLTYALAAIAIGILFAYLIAVRLTGKLYAIKAVSDAVRTGERQSRCADLGEDEVGQLAANLNEMLDSLRSTQEDLAATLQAMPDLMFELDHKGVFQNIWLPEHPPAFWNKELVGQDIGSLFSEETTTAVMESLAELSGKTSGVIKDIKLVCRNGMEKWYELSMAVKRQGRYSANYLIIARDITDRREAAEALQRSELFSRSIIENNPECITITQPDGTLNYVNQAGHALFEVGEVYGLLGRPMAEYLSEASAKAFNDALKRVYLGESISLELDAVTLAGNKRRLETYLQPFDLNLGQVKYVLGISRDISEQHQLRLIDEENRKKLLKNTESLTRAQRIAHIGNWEMDFASQELSWSDEVYRIFDLDRSLFKATFQAFLAAIHPDDKALVERAFSAAVNNREPYDVTHRLLMSDGAVKYVREIGEVIYDEDGEPKTAIGTCQDITAERIQEEQLQRSRKMEAMGKLTGGIAHDFNNMLGVMLGYADLLEPSCKAASQQRYVNEIIKAAERAKKLTSRLLAFSRQEARSVERVNVSELVWQSAPLLESTLTARSRLNLLLDDALWPVRLEKSRLEDAILNMCINARHAMPGGGTLTVTTENISLSAEAAKKADAKAGDYVLLRMADDGVGMDAETRGQIFDPFFTTKGEKGTGLGMSQVYGFVKQSKGGIEVESTPGGGTTFSLLFPRDRATESVSASSETDETIDLAGNETIMVVDDEAALRTMLKEQLTGQGYRVVTAASAGEALQRLVDTPVDLVISDVIMPGMDGYALAAEIAKSRPDLPIQLVSGFDDTQHSRGNDELRQQCLGKPVRINALLRRIRELLA